MSRWVNCLSGDWIQFSDQMHIYKVSKLLKLVGKNVNISQLYHAQSLHLAAHDREITTENQVCKLRVDQRYAIATDSFLESSHAHVYLAELIDTDGNVTIL